MNRRLRRSPTLAALYGAPIGLLGGLIGLGGAEFRLPVLAGVFGYKARRAVALNLAISLITVVSALLIRAGTLSLAPIAAILPVVVAMIAGAVSAAFVGTAFVHHITEHLLERITLTRANHPAISSGDRHRIDSRGVLAPRGAWLATRCTPPAYDSRDPVRFGNRVG